MKITSKSILSSPGRSNSLTTSLRRRLRSSGSIKGGASPAMFPAKKRSTFENQEPSSPKVTCIGQVRVKSKKKHIKKGINLSSSRRFSQNYQNTLGDFSSTKFQGLDYGEKGIRICNQNLNQECTRRWVHFPVTVCDALRAFGSEFSCLFPCRTQNDQNTFENKEKSQGGGGSCGAVFARWLSGVDDDGGGEREIEVVVGDDDDDDDDGGYYGDDGGVRKRRHVFEDLEIVDDKVEGHEGGRVSVCVPPKNALLLMRCRSDPVLIEALNNRSWEPNVGSNDEENKDLETEEDKGMILDQDQDQENVEQNEANLDQDCDNVEQYEVGQDQIVDNVRKYEVGQNLNQENVAKYDMGQVQDQENVEKDEMGQNQEEENVVGQDQEYDNVGKDEKGQDQNQVIMQKDDMGQDQDQEKKEIEEESLYLGSLFQENVEQDYEIQETHEEKLVIESEKVLEIESDAKAAKKDEKNLPECLLMMMYEPKLSMEVSKETWVCSQDFIKRNPSRKKPPPVPAISTCGNESSLGGGGTTINDVLRVADGGFPAGLPVPARSSCSLSAAPTMAAVLGQKLADAVGYEPFVLTRCKSEPMKTAAAKLLPESCVWETRKVDRLSRGMFGFGSARLGF